MEEREDRTVRFPLRMDKELHELLRRAAFLAGKSMHQYVIDAIRREIQKDSSKRGKPLIID